MKNARRSFIDCFGASSSSLPGAGAFFVLGDAEVTGFEGEGGIGDFTDLGDEAVGVIWGREVVSILGEGGADGAGQEGEGGEGTG